ncbi:MAG: molecular chaperone DnaJ [Clostridia bacterium]|nr:molecular chaperone DnaJ [Clostridia bacterium]
MPSKDYYKVLGVEKSATQDQIKSAYRKLAKQYHPDLHPGDEAAAEKFKEVNEAYSVVGDEEKRARYDRGEYDTSGMGGGGFNPFGGGGFSASGFDDIFDIFSDMFGGSSRRSAQQSAVGEDINHRVTLTFMESVLGCKKTINFSRLEKCSTCNGTGAKSEAHTKVCDKCGGSGQVRRVVNSLFGQQISIGACDKCGGTGRIVTEHCKTCGGRGVQSKNKVITVTIPAGVENGSVLQLSGEGHAPRSGKNGRNGNLLLVISVQPSKLFKRENNDLFVEVPVAYSTAVLGGEVEIPAPNGVFVHKIAEGTPNGETLRFRGRGVQTSRGYAGDLYATLKVEVPRGISRSQRKALEEFEREMSVRSYPKKKDYLDEIAKLYKKD